MDKPDLTTKVTSMDVLRSICAFLSSITQNEVMISQVNRVPDRKAPHVMVTLLREEATDYTIERLEMTGITRYITNTTVVVQVDCYSAKNRNLTLGDDAATTARILSNMVRTNYACDFFKTQAFEIQPLFSTKPQNLSFINDAQQYEQRHMFEMSVNYNPDVSFDYGYFTNIDLRVEVPVDLLEDALPHETINNEYIWDYYDLTHIKTKEFNDDIN